jgi:hypothetical protein
MIGAHADRTMAATHLDSRRVYRCSCGQTLRIFGGGRHRVYTKLANTHLDDPVMNHVCPSCGRDLPGKNGRTLAMAPTRLAIYARP